MPVGKMEPGGEGLVDAGEVPVAEEFGDVRQLIAQAGQIMGIELLDHVIVAESGTYSFKAQSQGGL